MATPNNPLGRPRQIVADMHELGELTFVQSPRETVAEFEGFSIFVDLATRKRLTGSVRTKVSLDREIGSVEYILVFENDMSLSPHVMYFYNISELDGVFGGLTDFARTAFRFNKTKHLILIQSDNREVLFRFLRHLHAIFKSKSINIDKKFHICFDQYISQLCINKYTDISNLNSLILENIALPSVPIRMDKMPISYLSLTGSLFNSVFEEDHFWDCITTSIGETLTHLKMNSMGMKTLPFNIMFLKKLQTLSLASNKLTQIPNFIGELDNLECLYINDNMLDYLPGCLENKTFKHLNIHNNKFKQKNDFLVANYDNIYNINTVILRPRNHTCLKLSELSFLSLINMCVKLNRREIPFTLRHLFYSFGRCRYCNILVMIDSTNETYSRSWVSSLNMTDCNTIMPWQHRECPFNCCRRSRVHND